MKKLLLTSILFLLFLPSYAQIDIKWFNGKTPEQIIARFGEPREKDLSGIEGSDFQVDYILFYDHFTVALNKYATNNREGYIEFFETDSADFIILSDIVTDGMRVGDSIQKLRATRFSTTPYGRNNPQNELLPMALSCGFGKHPESYCIYEQEYNWIGMTAENGIIKTWGFYSKPDIPYPDAASFF